MSAADFVAFLGTLQQQWDALRASVVLDLGIPFVSQKLSELFNIEDAWADRLLIDDADDGREITNSLVADMNKGLVAADLITRFIAEGDGAGNLILRSIDPAITGFSVAVLPADDTGGYAELGFASSDALLDGSFYTLTATPPQPGQLSQTAAFILTATTAQGATPTKVTIAKTDTDDNTGVANDVPKLITADNVPTFLTAQQLATRQRWQSLRITCVP